MKRIVSIALILCLMLSLIPAALAANTYSYNQETFKVGDSVMILLSQEQAVNGVETLKILDTSGLENSGLSVDLTMAPMVTAVAYCPCISGTASTPGTYNITVETRRAGTGTIVVSTHKITIRIEGNSQTPDEPDKPHAPETSYLTTGPVYYMTGEKVDLEIGYWSKTWVADIKDISIESVTGIGSSNLKTELRQEPTGVSMYLYGIAGDPGKYSITVTTRALAFGGVTVTCHDIPLTIESDYLHQESDVINIAAKTYQVGGEIMDMVASGIQGEKPSIVSCTGMADTGLTANVLASGNTIFMIYFTGTAKKAGKYTASITVGYTVAGVKKTAVYKVPITIDADPYKTENEVLPQLTFKPGDDMAKPLASGWTKEAPASIVEIKGLDNSGAKIYLQMDGSTQNMYMSGKADKVGKYAVTIIVHWTVDNKLYEKKFSLPLFITDGTTKEIDKVEVFDLVLPVIGEHAVNTASVPADANYTIREVQWMIAPPGYDFVKMPDTMVYDAESKYMCMIYLDPKPGYEFKYEGEMIDPTFVGDVTVQGEKPLSVFLWGEGADNIEKGTVGVLFIRSKIYEAAPSTDPQPISIEFEDVMEADWFYKDVMEAVKKGLINGMDAKHYRPKDYLTIAQAIKLAACMNQYYTDGKVTLTNSTTGAWYESYVEYAVSKGIITADQFKGRYNDKATREEYVTIFAKALPESEFEAINEVKDDAIPDVKTGDSCGSAVYKLYRAGILTGYEDGSFAPKKNIARSEVAAILTRMMDKTARKTVKLG